MLSYEQLENPNWVDFIVNKKYMDISRKKNEVTIKYKKNKVEVHLNEAKNSFSIKLPGKDFEFEKPGEYEVEGITVFASEAPKETFNGEINIVSLGDESGVNILMIAPN